MIQAAKSGPDGKRTEEKKGKNEQNFLQRALPSLEKVVGCKEQKKKLVDGNIIKSDKIWKHNNNLWE